MTDSLAAPSRQDVIHEDDEEPRIDSESIVSESERGDLSDVASPYADVGEHLQHVSEV